MRFAGLGGILCLVLALFFGGFGVSVFAQQSQDNPTVVVSPVRVGDVTPAFRYVGRVEATDTVELRARVEGILEQRLFQEGTQVQTGDLLFVIEKAPYEVEVQRRKADLAGARATYKNAQADLERKEALLKRKAVSAAVVDQAKAAAGTGRAAVLQAEAALKSAELNLSYTEIMSPITGIIGRARYSTGNLVKPSSDPLATVTTIDPVHVSFGVSEKQLIEARKRGIDIENPPVSPSLLLSDDSAYPHAGAFDFLSPNVSQSTDTITARALFPNPNRVLWPGQFVTVVVRQKQPLSALLVPQIAVQRDRDGYFVLTVDDGNIVRVRRIEVGQQMGADWVVTDGVSAGDRVVTQGLQKVRPDMEVSVKIADGA